MDRVIISEFNKDWNEFDQEVIDFHGVEITVKPTISIAEMAAFVRDIVKKCFDEETGEYLPELKDFVIRRDTVVFYSNVTLPDSLDDQYSLLYGTTLFDTICANINAEHYNIIMEAIDDKIEARIYTNEVEFDRKIHSAVDSLSALIDSLGGIFNGINNTDIQNLMQAISNTKIDEEKLAGAVVGAQAKAHENIIDFADAVKKVDS